MRTKERNVIIALIIVVLITTIFSIKAGASGKQYFSNTTDEAEHVYVAKLKEALKEFGYVNAGITMTKFSNDGREFEYTVKIHTPSTLNTDYEELENIESSLMKIGLEVENATVEFSFS